MDPNKIAEMLSEDIAPGMTGLNEDEKPKEPERGNLMLAKTYCDWVARAVSDLRRSMDRKDLRQARFHMKEILDYVDKAKEQVNLSAKEIGLPEFD